MQTSSPCALTIKTGGLHRPWPSSIVSPRTDSDWTQSPAVDPLSDQRSPHDLSQTNSPTSASSPLADDDAASAARALLAICAAAADA